MFSMHLLQFLIYLGIVSLIGAKAVSSSSKSKGWRKSIYYGPKLDENMEFDGELDESNAFSSLARYLKRFSHQKDFRHYSLKQIENAAKSLSSAQTAWKSMDGLTHRLKNTVKKSSSLQSRVDNFLSKKSRNTKEAAKLREYVTTVERSLQACEILQAISSSTKELQLQAVNLSESYQFSIQSNKVHCSVSFLQPEQTLLSAIPPELQPYSPNELVITITDDVTNEAVSIAQLLRLMTFESPVSIEVPTIDEPFFIQPTFLHLAFDTYQRLQSFLHNSSLVDSHNGVNFQVQRLRIIGYSSGGAVATYLSMILDGALNVSSYLKEKGITLDQYNGTSSTENSSPSTAEMINGTTGPNELNTTATIPPRSLLGQFRNRIRTFVIGSPPCIGRNIVPKYVTCIVHGDDITARIQSSSIDQFQKRMVKALESGAGTPSSFGWLLNPSLLQDVKTVAGKSLSRYRGAKKDSKSISLPGRVFFIKSRQYKKGATIQRVLRGNWQEDLLWNLHDIFISKKMFIHHKLEEYIRTLSRC